MTSRQRLLSLLQSHVPSEEAERGDRARMLDFAQRLADPFSRSQPEAHFTGSAVVVDPSGARIVLVHHARLGRWLQPGGHADPADGGDMRETALREAREETACDVMIHPSTPAPIDLDIHPIPARQGEPEHLHLDVRFLLVAQDPDSLRHDPSESLGATWLTWQEALAKIEEPGLRRLLRKARGRS